MFGAENLPNLASVLGALIGLVALGIWFRRNTHNKDGD